MIKLETEYWSRSIFLKNLYGYILHIFLHDVNKEMIVMMKVWNLNDGVEFVDKNERSARLAFKRAEKARQSLWRDGTGKETTTHNATLS